MNEKTALLPCPFCGSKDIKNLTEKGERAMITCWGCGVTMAWPDEERTIKAWNRRETGNVTQG